jgi:hypothetical protein
MWRSIGTVMLALLLVACGSGSPPPPADECQTAADCGDGEVCVTYFMPPVVGNGGTGGQPNACKPDPCAGTTLSCDCAQPALCNGYGFCNVDGMGGVVSCYDGG